MSGHGHAFVGHGDGLEVGDKVRGTPTLGGKSHHLFCQIKAINVSMGDGSESRGVVTLATADVENGGGPNFVDGIHPHLFVDQLHEGISQGGVISLVEEVAPRARLRLGIAHGVACF